MSSAPPCPETTGRQSSSSASQASPQIGATQEATRLASTTYKDAATQDNLYTIWDVYTDPESKKDWYQNRGLGIATWENLPHPHSEIFAGQIQ